VRTAAFAVALLLSGCMMLSITPGPPEPPPPPVPDKLQGDAPPPLVDVGIPECQAAPSLDPNLYYCAKDEHWYRFALNRWFMAFAWNGNWFPVSGAELPPALVKVTPKAEEVKKTREQKLEELEKQLEELERQEPSGEQDPP
jgi:hypothetical protein